jgi:hypothetical protein
MPKGAPFVPRTLPPCPPEHVLRPGGYLVFETRDPADRAWEEWSRLATRQVLQINEADTVERWTEIIEVTFAARHLQNNIRVR